jgi:hypothetical protein
MGQRADQRALPAPSDAVKTAPNNAAISPASVSSGMRIPKAPPQAPGIRAVTSISIFIRGSCNPATIIVAAGRASPSQCARHGPAGLPLAGSGRT